MIGGETMKSSSTLQDLPLSVLVFSSVVGIVRNGRILDSRCSFFSAITDSGF